MLNRFVLTIALFSLPLVGDALAQGEPWTTVEEIELRPTNPAHYLEFGVDLRLRGSTLLVGSRASFTGSTHVFDGSSGTWLETATLRPASEPSSGACDISGETIVAGAYANGAGGGPVGRRLRVRESRRGLDGD